MSTSEQFHDAFIEGKQLYRRYVNPYWYDAHAALSGNSNEFIKAFGATLYDDKGKEWLDLACSYGACLLGHAHPALTQTLVDSIQSGRPALSPFGVSSLKGYLAEQLVRLTGRNHCQCHFYTTGAEAVEGSIKIARSYTGRRGIVALAQGYHGMSFAASSLTNLSPWRDAYLTHKSIGDDVSIAPDIRSMCDALEMRQHALVIIEPIQGLGGGAFIDAQSIKLLRETCDRTGTLLAVDETLTGAGRTGRFLASHLLEWDIAADFTIISKSLTGGFAPLSVLVGSNHLMKHYFGKPGWERLHGSTFNGNDHAVAVAIIAVKQISAALEAPQPGIDLLTQELSALAMKASARLQVKCYGALFFIGFPEPDGSTLTSHLFFELYDRRILVLPCAQGTKSLKLLPPLNLTVAEARTVVTAIENALAAFTRGGDL